MDRIIAAGGRAEKRTQLIAEKHEIMKELKATGQKHYKEFRRAESGMSHGIGGRMQQEIEALLALQEDDLKIREIEGSR